MTTRVIPTKVHGVLDYVTGPALTFAPELLRLDGSRASALAPRLGGAAATAYSALTDYELGVRKVVPMRVHLLLDALSGTALAATPWVFGAARRGKRHWLPHALVGANEVLLSLTTKTEPPRRSSRAPRVLAFAVPAAAAGAAVAYVAGRRLAGRGAAPAAESAGAPPELGERPTSEVSAEEPPAGGGTS